MSTEGGIELDRSVSNHSICRVGSIYFESTAGRVFEAGGEAALVCGAVAPRLGHVTRATERAQLVLPTPHEWSRRRAFETAWVEVAAVRHPLVLREMQ